MWSSSSSEHFFLKMNYYFQTLVGLTFTLLFRKNFPQNNNKRMSQSPLYPKMPVFAKADLTFQGVEVWYREL